MRQPVSQATARQVLQRRFDSSATFALLLVIAMANAEQIPTITVEELFYALSDQGPMPAELT
jgi:hypothetical protein